MVIVKAATLAEYPQCASTVLDVVSYAVLLAHLKIHKDMASYSHLEMKNLKNREVSCRRSPQVCGRAGL